VEKVSYRKNFRDIVRGYSSSNYKGQSVYIKHLTPHDQIEIEEIEENYYNKAVKRGVPTREEMLSLLREEGDWTDAEEAGLEKERVFLKNLIEAKSKIVLPSHLASQDKLITESREKIQKKEQEKEALLGNTCEKYALERTNDYYIIKSFFKDSDLVRPLFLEKEFDYLTSSEVHKVVLIYNQVFSTINEENIQHLILQDFFTAYLGFTEDSMQFFGKPFCELTYCQIKLIVYSKIFKNIFESEENIPEKIRKDPQALMDYASTAKEEKEKLQDKFSQSDGSTLVGATRQDYQELGLGSPGSVDLHEEAKKKGGTLSMQDLMKLSGVEQ